MIGHICDLIMAGQNWAIRQRAVKAGDRFFGIEVQTPARQVGWTSNEEWTAFMHLTGEAVEQGSRQQLALVGAADWPGRTDQSSNKSESTLII
jgi:hypothetical protein